MAHLGGQLVRAPQRGAGLPAGLAPPLDPAQHQQAAGQLQAQRRRPMRRDRRPGRLRRGVQVAGRGGGQRVDPVGVAGQRGTAQPPAELPQPGRDPPGVVGPPDRDVGLGQQVSSRYRTPGSAQSSWSAHHAARSKCRSRPRDRRARRSPCPGGRRRRSARYTRGRRVSSSGSCSSARRARRPGRRPRSAARSAARDATETAASRTRRPPRRPPPPRPRLPRSRRPAPRSSPGSTRRSPAPSRHRCPWPGRWTAAARPARCPGPRCSATTARGAGRRCRTAGSAAGRPRGGRPGRAGRCRGLRPPSPSRSTG